MQKRERSVASNAKRMGAFMIDDMVVNLFLMIIFSSQLTALMSQITEVNATSVAMVNQFIINHLPIVLAIKVLYHGILIWQTGMTVGKYLLKIKTVDATKRETPTFMQALWRASLRLLSEMFFYLGFLFAFFSPLHQTLHDKLSNTVVIDV